MPPVLILQPPAGTRVDLSLPKLPPPESPNRGGGDSSWEKLVTAPNDIEAHLLTGRLSVAGIESRKLKERSLTRSWLIAGSDPWTPVTVYVRRFDLDPARLVLAEVSLEAAPLDSSAEGTDGTGGAGLTWLGGRLWPVAAAVGILLTIAAVGAVPR